MDLLGNIWGLNVYKSCKILKLFSSFERERKKKLCVGMKEKDVQCALQKEEKKERERKLREREREEMLYFLFGQRDALHGKNIGKTLHAGVVRASELAFISEIFLE